MASSNDDVHWSLLYFIAPLQAAKRAVAPLLGLSLRNPLLNEGGQAVEILGHLGVVAAGHRGEVVQCWFHLACTTCARSVENGMKSKRIALRKDEEVQFEPLPQTLVRQYFAAQLVDE